MNRRQLEHVIEEVGRRTGLEYFYIIGAAAVLAELPEPTDAALVQTRDVDVVPGTSSTSEEDRIANQIDWVLGEGSDFEIEHQYYAQGLSRSSPQFAPSDWMMRARPVRAGAYTRLCMEVHDLALSKFGAGDPRTSNSTLRWRKPEYWAKPNSCNGWIRWRQPPNCDNGSSIASRPRFTDVDAQAVGDVGDLRLRPLIACIQGNDIAGAASTPGQFTQTPFLQ